MLAGLVQMDAAKQDGSIGLSRLINLACGTECCHVVGEVLNDGQLGRFCAENGFMLGLEDGLSDEVVRPAGAAVVADGAAGADSVQDPAGNR